jgi:hypothetical protein
LILIQVAFGQLGFTLLLERNDNQGHEDVHKEEWKDNEEHHIKQGYLKKYF